MKRAQGESIACSSRPPLGFMPVQRWKIIAPRQRSGPCIHADRETTVVRTGLRQTHHTLYFSANICFPIFGYSILLHVALHV